MKQCLVLLTIVASIAAENPLPEKESKDDLKKPVQTLNYRRISRLNTDELGSEENPLATGVGNPVPVYDIKTIDPAYASGTLPNGIYPNADFVVYGTNSDFVGFDMYVITGVSDAVKCGSQFCYGDRKCTHFSYQVTDGVCWLKSNFGSGSNWATISSLVSGFIPQRACNVNTATVASLLNCLTLAIL